MKTLALITAICLSVFSFATEAKEHQVQLLTSGADGQMMIMSPGFLKIAPGDSVTFVPSDSSHNVESMAIPESAAPFNSKMGQKVTLTFTEQGVYLYKCTPHFALGMLGVIQVGNALNLEDVKQQWQSLSTGVALNKERVPQYLSQVK